jgi:hypothetical protein
MDARATDYRAQRGLALAKAKRDAIKPIAGSKFLVPGATFSGGYVVDTQEETCTCPDFLERGGHGRLHRCKHIWAALYRMSPQGGSAVVLEESEEKERINYARDWRATNACRTLIPRLGPTMLAELVDGLGLPPPAIGVRGRPAVPPRDVLLAAALRTFEEKTAGSCLSRSARDPLSCVVFVPTWQQYLVQQPKRQVADVKARPCSTELSVLCT